MKREKYRGLWIEGRSSELRYSMGFVAQTDVERHDKDGVTVRPVYIQGIFATSTQSVEAALAAGRTAIDDPSFGTK